CVAPDSGVVYVTPMTYSPDPDVSPLASSELSFSFSVDESKVQALMMNIIHNNPISEILFFIVFSLSHFLTSFPKFMYPQLAIMYACEDVVPYYVQRSYSCYLRCAQLPSCH